MAVPDKAAGAGRGAHSVELVVRTTSPAYVPGDAGEKLSANERGASTEDIPLLVESAKEEACGPTSDASTVAAALPELTIFSIWGPPTVV